MPRGHRFTLGQQPVREGRRTGEATGKGRNKRTNKTYHAGNRGEAARSVTIGAVSAALPTPDAERVLTQLRELIAIDSVGGTPGEVGIQRHLADAARSEGWDVHSWDIDLAACTAKPDFPGMEVPRSDALGVLARIPGTGGGRTLLLNGHTDVVPPGDLAAWGPHDPFSPREDEIEGRASLIGRGACDMKGGLVAAWEAIRIVREAGIDLRGDILIAPVSGEEDGGLGTFALIEEMKRQGIHPDGCVVPEPTDCELIPANAGALTFRIRVPGAAIHASRRSEGVSAIEKFVPILTALAELERMRNTDVDPLMQRWPIAYPLSIGTVHAGDWASTVPDLLIAEGRYGVALDEDVASARSVLERAVADACARDPWLREHPATVEWWGGQFASGRTAPDAEIVELVRHHATANTGTPPDTYAGPYGSDLRLLTTLGSIPTVQYGPGDSANAHAPNEYVAIDDVLTCASVIASTIIDFCR